LQKSCKNATEQHYLVNKSNKNSSIKLEHALNSLNFDYFIHYSQFVMKMKIVDVLCQGPSNIAASSGVQGPPDRQRAKSFCVRLQGNTWT